ncbi:hypothetical protein PG989_001819 [Apiospora arundinis]
MVTNHISCVVPPYLLSGIAENDKNKEHIRQPAPNAEPGTWLKIASPSSPARSAAKQWGEPGHSVCRRSAADFSEYPEEEFAFGMEPWKWLGDSGFVQFMASTKARPAGADDHQRSFAHNLMHKCQVGGGSICGWWLIYTKARIPVGTCFASGPRNASTLARPQLQKVRLISSQGLR